MTMMRAGRGKRPAPKLFAAGMAALLTLAALPGEARAQAPTPDIEAALRSADGSREVRAFYRARGYRPLWIRGGRIGPEADRLLDLIETAEIDGVDGSDHRPRALADAIERAQDGAPEDLAQAEMLLSRSFAGYVRDMRRPRQTRMVYVDKELAPTVPPVRSVLEAAAVQPSLLSYLETMGWMHPLYGQLRAALAAQAVGGDRGPHIPSGPILRPGDEGERVEMLRDRLGLDPYGAFDGEVGRALRRVQAAHGLPQDGLAGPRTLAALNTASPEREEILRINLDRVRALPAGPSGRYVLVDAASARLWMYENGRVRDSMRVIVGKSTEQTPMMAGLIRFAQVNPYWNIPPDLVRIRVAPGAITKGPAFLQEMRYEALSDWTANARTIDPATVDWQAVASGQREVRVRQLPGGDNAMGRMKFMFPNELGIYLHDTPEKGLFRAADRRFSSGCVRLEDAQRLARWLFGKPLTPKPGAPEQQVNLPRPVPVYITYLTAMPEGQTIAFRSDVYGRDGVQFASGQRGVAGR